LSSFLAALQLADSALPVGRFAHSSGLEALSTAGALDECDLSELVETVIVASTGPLDGVAVAHAHRANDIAELTELDRVVTARKIAPAARLASTACGRRLAALGAELTGAEPFRTFSALSVSGGTDANLPVVEGALARARGLTAEEAVLVELRSGAAALLSAAVRLGILRANRAQVMLATLDPVVAETARSALTLGLDEMYSTVPELELYALMHPRLDHRLFMT
jgi:urease accessory protein